MIHARDIPAAMEALKLTPEQAAIMELLARVEALELVVGQAIGAFKSVRKQDA